MNTKRFLGTITFIAGVMIMLSLTACDNGTETGPGNGDDEEGTLTGSVTIDGIPKYTHRIWADISLLGGNGEISYQWIRGASTNIGTGVYYDITAADIGQTLKVRVRRSEETGTKTSAAVTPAYHKIGDQGPAGGIVFYDDMQGDWLPSGKRFIEIADKDVSTSPLPWGVSGTEVTAADYGSQLGKGKLCHDAAVSAGAGNGTAAGECEAYTVTLYDDELWERTFDDWFLPGLGEMTRMLDYQEKDNSPYSELTYNNNNPGLNGKYWTSFISSANDAYFVGFVSDPDQYGSLYTERTAQHKVRAIRWF